MIRSAESSIVVLFFIPEGCRLWVIKKMGNGPDVIRTHDLPVISRAHHLAMLRALRVALLVKSSLVFIGYGLSPAVD